MIKITGLWLNESKAGDKYLSGSWGSVKVLVFKNMYHNNDNTQPLYILYLDNKDKKKGEK